MTGIIFVLLVLGYLVFLIDWREFRDVLAQGGWAAIGIYVIVGILIYNVLVTPNVVASAPAVHH